MEGIELLKQELEIAKTNGLRPELIMALEERLKEASGYVVPEIQKELDENKKFIELYKQTKEWLIQHEGDKESFVEYLEKLKQIEELEDEGRKKGILYFMSEEEQLAVFKRVFGKDVEFLPPTPVSKANLEGVKDG